MIKRRDFLAIGALGGAGLTLPVYNSLASTGEIAPQSATAGILVFLRGGPSHLDTLDPKPGAPAEYRGEFRAISTNVPGIKICEHLPKLAGCADKFAVVRGVSHTFADHSLGSEYVNTGSRPLASLKYPAYGATLAKERPADRPVPPYVTIPSLEQGPGFLGAQFSPFCPGGLPRPGRAPGVRGISLPTKCSLEEFDRRHEFLRELDCHFQSLEGREPVLDAIDAFTGQAYDIIRSPETREAFDLTREAPSFAQRFGDSEWGGACLLAIRLVEAGVRFVTLSFGGWDTHADNFPTLKNNLLPKLDAALAGLFTGLEDRGLLDSTAVLVTGEFGRTPKINGNPNPGRDHYPKCMSLLMAGGRIGGGQIVGESDVTGSEPVDLDISPADIAATFYANLGIEPGKVYRTSAGRPITLVRDGTAIRRLFL